jgi:DNA-binding NarL/FixJ family response regulator
LRPVGVSQLIIVGGISRISVLTEGFTVLGASAAVNADLPYADVVSMVDAALRAGPVARSDRQRALARLRDRQAEAVRFARLTDHEAAVLASLIAGMPAALIADGRSVTLATVRSQIASILRKLEVSSQLAAIALAHRSCRDPRLITTLIRHRAY